MVGGFRCTSTENPIYTSKKISQLGYIWDKNFSVVHIYIGNYMVKNYSFKLSDHDEDERQLIELLDTWRESGGTIKGFLLNQVPKPRTGQFITRDEWQHERAILSSLYSLFDGVMQDVEALKCNQENIINFLNKE